MAYQCSQCGNDHDELPRFFMFKRPEDSGGKVIETTDDRKSMCSTDSQSFVHCEVEVPIAGGADGVLGFIVWVEVSLDVYDELLAFRASENAAPDWSEWVEGKLANPVTGVPGSFGTPVKFAVIKNDPTPYVKWVAPDSPLAQLLAAGASQAYWHDLAAGRL